MKQIDLNADLGEGYGPWKIGDDAAMMRIVTSANIACGGHAGDNSTMFEALTCAKENGVSIGAHPGFEDREGFGRRRLPLTMTEVERLSAAQIGALCGVAALAGAEVDYVKPHGALCNWAAEEADVADAIMRALVAVMGPDAALLAISGTELEKSGLRHGLRTYSEIFADRGYTPGGLLVPRGTEGAMIHDEAVATQRLLGFFESGLMPTVGGEPVALKAHSICVHGDGPRALDIAGNLRAALESAGHAVKPFAASIPA